METTTKTPKLTPGNPVSIESDKDYQARLSANIMLALEVKNAFEMYSYRIISPEDFIERIKDLTEFHLSNHKK